jgi:hypothetical protein
MQCHKCIDVTELSLPVARPVFSSMPCGGMGGAGGPQSHTSQPIFDDVIGGFVSRNVLTEKKMQYF